MKPEKNYASVKRKTQYEKGQRNPVEINECKLSYCSVLPIEHTVYTQSQQVSAKNKEKEIAFLYMSMACNFQPSKGNAQCQVMSVITAQ